MYLLCVCSPWASSQKYRLYPRNFYSWLALLQFFCHFSWPIRQNEKYFHYIPSKISYAPLPVSRSIKQPLWNVLWTQFFISRISATCQNLKISSSLINNKKLSASLGIRSSSRHLNKIIWPSVEILNVSNSITKTQRNGCSTYQQVEK